MQVSEPLQTLDGAIRMTVPDGHAEQDPWRPDFLRGAHPGRWILANLAVAVLYCTLGWAVSQFFARYGLFPAPVWLPASIALVAAMMGGARMLPGIFLGSFVANHVLFDAPLLQVTLVSLGNAAGPVLGAAALRRMRPEAGLFNRLRGVILFIAFAIMLHPAITASGGMLTLYMIQGLDYAILPGIWISWWLSDSGGTLFFAPAFVLWLGMEREAIPRPAGRVFSDRLFWALITVVLLLLVIALPVHGTIRWSFPFLLVVLLSWIALRISLRAAYTLISVVAVTASAGAVAGFGPFGSEEAGNPMQLVGVLVVALALNVLTIIALVAERRAAEEANRLKSMRLAAASHDLRTPLNAILGFSDMMRKEVLGPIETPRYKEYVEHIHGSGEVLMDIIDEILDLSRIEAGRQDMAPEAVDGHELARTCLQIVSLKAAEKEIRLILEAVPGATVFADAKALRQILLNLIANAVKFTPPKGSVTVRIRESAKGDSIIEVADTGIGMSPEEIEIALKPFGQVAQAEVTTERGTGLGLPIAHRLAELHGGRFQITSAPGKGTTVRVTLPAAAPSAS
jgi:two-component system, cell cycle sensor histidine kinase PleC